LATGIGANREIDPVGEPGARRPELVPAHHEAVAAKGGARRQRREIAPRVRLGEALTEDEAAPRDLRQQPLAELLRAEALERAADGLVREEVEGEGQPVVAEDVLDEGGVDVREPASARLDRPGHPDPTSPAELGRHLPRVAVRGHSLPLRLGALSDEPLEPDRDDRCLLAERSLLGGQAELHVRRS